MAKWSLNGVEFSNYDDAKLGCDLYDALVEKHGRKQANDRWPTEWKKFLREREERCNSIIKEFESLNQTKDSNDRPERTDRWNC